MCVLTATGLIVGIVVSERQQRGPRGARAAEALLQEKENEIAHAARFSLVSGMTSALAHEINQPMAAARALARSAQELLRQPQADLPRAEKNLTTLVAAIDLASGIVRRMREFMRRGRPHVSTIDVANMFDDTLTLIRPAATSNNISIEVEVSADASPIHGDRIQLQQVVLNLVRNASIHWCLCSDRTRSIRVVAQPECNRRIEIGVATTARASRPDSLTDCFSR